MTAKRTLDTFFAPPAKKRRPSPEQSPNNDNSKSSDAPPSTHPTYPFPVPQLPNSIATSLNENIPTLDSGKCIRDQPHLDLVYFKSYVPRAIENTLFTFLRENLFFYRVQYKIKRGAIETQINTPRYTTVFGVDDSSIFGPRGSKGRGDGRIKDEESGSVLLDANTKKPVLRDRYKCGPRPIPACLAYLKNLAEISTAQTYNFCLVNYYASGSDSISYHSDDERFLGPNPAIASFSLGAKRDFLMKHKPTTAATASATTTADGTKKESGAAIDGKTRNGVDKNQPDAKPLKLPLDSGDMILMRGATQRNWLHSIPKRKGGESDKGRINITFRKAMARVGTENYYQYNVGAGGVFRWSREKKEMVSWTP